MENSSVELTAEQLAQLKLEKHREWRREYQRKYRQEHPDRTRELNRICMKAYRKKLKEKKLAAMASSA